MPRLETGAKTKSRLALSACEQEVYNKCRAPQDVSRRFECQPAVGDVDNKHALAVPPVSHAAVRMRRCRARRRKGLRVVQVQLRETEVDALIESGWLEERSSNDLSAMIDALHRVFSSMTRATPRGQ